MLITEDNSELMDWLETTFAKYSELQYGVPLGIGLVDITTNSPHLDVFADAVRVAILANEENAALETESDLKAFLARIQGTEQEQPEWEFRNSWISAAKRKGWHWRVTLWRHKETGACRSRIVKVSYAALRGQLLTSTCFIRAQCTLPKTEEVARELLLRELDERQRKQYLLTDSFVEMGRSGVMYVLRRNRPTLALRPVQKLEVGCETSILAALCMHPLAYYTGSWAGVMPPSDEILSHLLHIRSDEHRYWKVCNQHRPDDYLGGL